MSLIPVDAVRETTVPARLRIITPKVTPDVIPLRFNPTEYQLQKQNNFAEIAIPGVRLILWVGASIILLAGLLALRTLKPAGSAIDR